MGSATLPCSILKQKLYPGYDICLTQRHTQVLTKPFGQKMSKHAWLHYALIVTKSLQPSHTELCQQHQKDLPLLSVSKNYTDQREYSSSHRKGHRQMNCCEPHQAVGKDSAQQLNDSPCKESDKQECLLHSDLVIYLSGFQREGFIKHL